MPNDRGEAVWTPKRVLLLVMGFAVFISAYTVYAGYLGYIDGLPPLPPEYEPCDCGIVDNGVQPPARENEADRRLRQAFGEECPELKRTIKLEVRARGVVLAADQFKIEDDGRVKLQPFSIALFGKTKNASELPEINTIRSDVAFLTFDRPISSATEMSNRKITGATLVQDRERAQESERRGYEGGVLIVNNRRTSQRDDDMSLFTPGPVYYQENLHRIWTAEVVKITDLSSKPNPTVITATGMDVYLSTEPAKPPQTAGKAAAKDKAKSPTVNGVERITLRADVDMHLYVDAKNGFLGASKAPADQKPGTGDSKAGSPAAASAPGNPAASPPKALITIRTQGPFTYDLNTDRARFDISQHPGPHPNFVTVTRQNEPRGPCDQLVCEHLDLQLHRKNAPKPAGEAAAPTPKPAADDDRSVELEIESAHATGNQVILTSDSEVLTAFGNDLTYNTLTRESVIKGTPEMVAMKEGNEIYARELVLIGVGEKNSQQATAKGPGRIEMRDRGTGRRTLHANWKDTLISSKDGPYDILVLTGDARFEDTEHGQLLEADVLKVWLEPEDTKPAPSAAAAPAQPGSSESGRRRPHHLDARGHVRSRSPEINVPEADHLVVWFNDAPPAQAQLPAALPPANIPAPATATPRQPDQAGTKPPSPEPSGRPGAAPPTAAADSTPEDLAKPKRPIDLCARFVEAFVLRNGPKNDMDKLWCEGNVRVRQDPVAPDDKGVDIRGQTLQMKHYVEGNVLLVTGDLAEVHLDKLSILGPEVNIDQKENTVWVNGIGAMRMPSNTNFQGDKLEKASDLTVHWNRNMFFNGKDAQFYGGIQAEQENARLACQTMQVFLDRFVSLKEGEKKGTPPAKVEKLVCDKNVRIEDTVRENGKLLRYTKIDSREFVHDQDGIVIAPGPGVVRILQLGGKDEAAPAPKPQNPAANPRPAEEELKLTRVTYLGRMFANNNTRTAIFYDTVEVVNLPGDNPDLPIDIDHLPPGGLYLKCEQLKVYTRKEKDGKSNHEMEAHRKAMVQSREFWGQADVIKYDESKEQVIFEASEGNLATLYRVIVPGQKPDEIKGKKITYWRRTNDFKIDEGSGIRSTITN